MDCLAALCQISPVLGDLERNLEAHLRWLDRACEAGADLVLFPELSLHGYFLRDLTQEVALPLDHPAVVEIVSRSVDCSIVFGMAEESPEHRWFNSAVFAEDGHILDVHRKVHLPDYGIFEEGRYFASGNRFETIASKHGRFGVLVCEDAWHLSSGWLQFLDGADALLLPSAGPARGIDTEGAELSSQSSWRILNAAHALFFQAWVLHCNRVGFEEGTQFWGASSVHTPFGKVAAEAVGQEEEMLLQRIDSGPLRRARMMSPLRRDARPDLVRRRLAQLLQDPDALRASDAAAAGAAGPGEQQEPE